MTSRFASALYLRDLARLRRVRDRIGREYAQPPYARLMARRIERDTAHATAGMPSRVARQVTRPIRIREALALEPRLA